MATWGDYFREKQSEQQTNPVAPTGLQQTASRFANEQTSWAQAGQGLQPWLPEASYMETARSWYGGANPNSTQNGWDNNFIDKAFEQQYNYLEQSFKPDEQGVRHPSLYYKWLDDPDAHGVATWNDPKGRFKVGDVFVAGKKQEGQNLYEVFDEYTADVMLADFMFSNDERQRFNGDKDVQARYRREVQGRTESDSEQALNAPSAEASQGRIKSTQEAYLEGWQQPAIVAGSAVATGVSVWAGTALAAAGTAALTGTAATSWLGPAAVPIGIGAGIIAGFSAWLNSDSLTETAAYATEVVHQSRARSTHNLLHDTGNAIGAYGGTLGRKMINPLSNATQGTFDVVSGGTVGDGESNFYKLDEKGERIASGRWQAADFGAQALDAIAMWSSPVGKGLDLATMGMAVTGSATNFLSAEGFNQRIGNFDHYDDTHEWAAAFGNVAIDAVQMTTMGGIAQRFKNNKTLDTATGTLANGERVVAGTRFQVDAAGKATSHRMTMERWAPSEAARWMTINARARLRAQRNNGVVDSDALYQASLAMSTDKAWSRAIVNGYAEGIEEFVQGILEPISYSERIDPDALIAGTISGFMGGMGMSLGTLSRPANPEKIREAQVKLNFLRSNGLDTIDDATWKQHYAGMTETEKELHARFTPETTKEASAAWKIMTEVQKANVGSTSILGNIGQEAVRTAAMDRVYKGAIPATDSRVKILGQNGGEMVFNGQVEKIGGGNTAVLSATQFIRMMGKKLDAYVEMAKNEALAADIQADLANQIKVTSEIFKHFMERYTELMAMSDPDLQKAKIAEMNHTLSSTYNGRHSHGGAIDPNIRWFSQQAVEFKLKRDPVIGAGSVGIYLPQISYALTRGGGDGVVSINQVLLKAPGADHDGDDAADLNMQWWSREDWQRMRVGGQYIIQGPSSEKITIQVPDPDDPSKTLTKEVPGRSVTTLEVDAPDDEGDRIDRINTMLEVKGSPREKIVHDAYRHWFDNVLYPHYVGSGVLTSEQFTLAWLQFEADMANGDKKARVKFGERLFDLNFQGMLMLSETTGMPEVAWLWDQITDMHGKIMIDNARFNATEFMGRFKMDPAGTMPMSSDWRMPEELKFQEEIAVRDGINQGVTLGIMLGVETNRSAMKIYYTFYRSAVDSWDPKANGWVPERVAELARQYTFLNSGDVESGSGQITNVNRIEDRVINQLVDIASLGNQPVSPQAVMQIAMTRVPDIGIDPATGLGYLPPDAGDISMLQLLLRKSVEMEEARISQVPLDDPIRAKITMYKNLSHAGDKSSYTAKTAFMEVFRDHQAYEIVGHDAAYIGPNITLGQMEQQLLGMDSDSRVAWLAAIRMCPAYHSHHGQGDPPYDITQYESPDGSARVPINAFTMMVDALTASVNTRVAQIQRKDDEGIDGLVLMISNLRATLDKHKLSHKDRLSTASNIRVLNDWLEANPYQAQKIIDALPPNALPAIFQGNRAVPSLWLEQLLSGVDYDGVTKATPERLAVNWKVQTWLAAFNAAGGRIIRERNQTQNETTEEKERLDREWRDKHGVEGAVRYGYLDSRMLQLMHRLAAKRNAEHGELVVEETPIERTKRRWTTRKQEAPTPGARAAKYTPGRGAMLDLDLLIKFMYEATDLYELRTNVNAVAQWHVGREMQFMMMDDKSDFEVDPQSIWAANLPSALQRDKINELTESLNIVNETQVEEAAALATRKETLRDLKLYHEQVVAFQKDPTIAPKPVNIGNTSRLYALLSQGLTNRARMTDSRGPNIRNLVSRAGMSGLISSHNKGSTDKDFEAYGNALITMRSLGVMTDVDLETAAWTAHNWTDVQANLTKLAEGPHRIQLDDGTELIVDFSDIGFMLEALDDPRLQSVATAVLVQTSRDVNANGMPVNYNDVLNMSLTQILEEQNFNQVFADNRPILERAHKWASYVDARATKMAEKATVVERDRATDLTQNIINDFLVRYLQQPGVQNESSQGILDELMKDLYEASVLIAQLKTDVERERLRKELKIALAKRFRDQSDQIAALRHDDLDIALREGTIVTTLLAYTKEQEEKLTKQRQKKAKTLLKTTDQAERDALQEEIDELDDQLQAVADALTQLGTTGSPINLPRFDDLDVDTLINKYALTGDPQGDMHRKVNILGELLRGNTIERYRSTKEVQDLIEKAIRLGSKRNKAFFFMPEGTATERRAKIKAGKKITDDEWAILTEWVVSATISDATSRGSSQVQLWAGITEDEKTQSHKYYDVTGASLVDDLFDALLVGPTKEMISQSPMPEQFQRPTVKKARDKILNALFDERKIGTWTDRVPVEGMKLRSLLRNSPVALAIPRGGDTPRRIMDLIASGHVTVETRPIPTEHHSTAMAAYIEVGEVLENHLTWQEIMKLDNHFVQQIKVTPGIKTLAQQGVSYLPELDMMQTNATIRNFSHPDVETSGYEVLSLQTLQSELDARLPDEGYLDYNIEIVYVDVDKKPYTAEYVNSIYFDGVGRETHVGRGGGPLAQLWLAQGGLSKISQQQPLNWLTKAGKRFRHLVTTDLLDVERLENSGLSVTELMQAKALRLLSKDDYDTGYLLREDIPALLKMIKMRHLVIGWEVNPATNERTKRVFWADEWIYFEHLNKLDPQANPMPNLQDVRLVYNNEQTTQTLLGRMGERGKKGVWGDPNMVMTDGVAMPNLDLERLKNLGLERIGETALASNSFLAQVQPRQKTQYRKAEDTRKAQREYDAKMEKWEADAAPYRTSRSQQRKSAFDAKKQRKTHQATLLDYLIPEKFSSVISRLGIPVDRLVDPASYRSTKHMINRIEKIQKNYPEATISLYVRDGSSNPSRGVYAKAEMDSQFNSVPDYQRPIVKDVWLVDVDAYKRLAGNDDELAFNMAKADLAELMSRGVYVVPVTKQGNIDFRADVINWINLGERGYRAMADDSYMFGPANPATDVGVNTEALASTQSNTAVFDGKSPHWAIRVLGPWFPTNENTVQYLPRGQAYRKHARAIVPTSYSNTGGGKEWSYGVPTDAEVLGSGGLTQKEVTARKLLAILDDPDGLEWMAKDMAKGDPKSRGDLDMYKEHPNGDITEGILPIRKALEDLRDELKAGLDPLRPAKVLRPGAAYPLLSADGSNVMVARFGFKAPDPFEHDIQATTMWKDLPAGVVVFGNQLEDAQTTTPPLTITRVEKDKRGVMVVGKYEMSDVGKRTNEGIGFKPGAVPWSNKYRPKDLALSRFNDVHITESTSAQAPAGKNAIGGDEGGTITGFKHLFTLGGANFWPDMVDFFFGAQPKRSKEEYDRLEALVLHILDEWSHRDHGYTATEIASLLSANVWGQHLSNELTDYAQEIAGPDLRAGLEFKYDETNPDVERDDVNKRIATIILAQLAVPGIHVGHVMSTPGLLTLRDGALNTQVRSLPDLMCDAMNDIRFYPMKDELIGRVNSIFSTDANDVPVYWFDDDFRFWFRTEDDELIDVRLQMVLDQPADQNPVTNVHSNVTKSKQDISVHYSTAIWGGTGGQQMAGKDLVVTNENPNIIDFQSGQTLFDVLTRVEENDRTFPSEAPVTPAENLYFRHGGHKVGVYTQPITLIPDPSQPSLETEVALKQKDILLAIGFNISQVEDMRVEVDYLVRQFLGSPGPEANDQLFAEEIDAGTYLEIATIIHKNIKNHLNPLNGGLVYWPHHSFWKMAYLANQNLPIEKRWGPVVKEGWGKKKIAATWYEWVNALNGQVRDSKYEFDATWRSANDGFWHTYQGSLPEYNTIQLSDSEMVQLQLRDPETNERYVSNDPILRMSLSTPEVMDFAVMTYDFLIAEKLAVGSVEDSREIPFSAMSDKLKYLKSWQENNNIKRQKKTSIREYMKEGALNQESTRTSTLFFRAVVNLSMQRVLNPALWVEALISVPMRQALEHATNMLLGEYTGTGGTELAKMRSNPKYSDTDIKMLREAAKMLGSDTEWLAGVIRDTTYRQLVGRGGQSAVGAGLEKFAAMSAKLFADPRWNQRGRSIGLRYLEGVMDYYNDSGAMITVPQLVDNLRRDIRWVEHSSPKTGVSAHSVGTNRFGQVRATRNTVSNKIMMSGIESLCASDRMLFAIPGHLAKIPLLFNRFAMNQFMTITGLNVIDQMVAVNINAKKKGGLWHRSIGARLGQDDPGRGEYDMSDVIDSLDLTRAVARTGVSQTAFMALGFIANGYGLGGEDEEMRRRRRMAMYLDVPLQYDPRRAENDFVNADAIYFDSVPYLSTHYMDPETGRSAMVPHWIIRQFTSPMMGIQRFFETGDVREIGYGFLDAAQALPYSVVNTWKEADTTARLLADAAKMEDREISAEAQQQESSLLMRVASIYEKALVESTFINTMRNGWDQFDRNPWFVPQTTEGGDIVHAEGYQNKPLRTNALIEDAEQMKDPVTGEPMVDENGQPVMETVTAYRQRTGRDAAVHQYAENNATFAFLASLFSGQLNGESSYWRKNMVNVEREVPLPNTVEADLEALVMSAYLGEGGQPKFTFDETVRMLKTRDENAGVFWDQTKIEAQAKEILEAHSEIGAMSIISPEGRELITDDGMEAVFKSLQAGGVTFGDISLQGIHADKAMRDRIAEKWTTALIQEGIDNGMEQQAAEFRMRRFWYGDSTNPDWPGLRELLYSNDIPRADTQRYDQLNVTYAIGPDGKPWATPFTRQSVWGAILPVAQKAPEVGPGMGRDQTRGKDVDLTLGINTGLHGLIRQQEEPLEPDDKPMEKSAAKEYTPTTKGVPRKPFKRFGSGGGGGYTNNARPYFQRMQALPRGQAPQIDGIRQINVNTPYIRRATVREERISSERGRLKQWQ